MRQVYDFIVIGGGLSGLMATERLAHKGQSVLCLEKEEHVGGLLKGESVEGYLLETGPTAFMKSYEEVNSLIERIGLSDEVISNTASNTKRYILKNGVTHPLFESTLAFLKSDLLSFKGKLRLMMEPFIARTFLTEESVYEFAKHRFGDEVAETLFDAVVSGICAGDSKKIDIRSLFNKLNHFERGNRSLLLLLQKFKKMNSSKKPLFYTLRGGMGTICKQLYQRNSNRVLTNAEVFSIKKQGPLYLIKSSRGDFYSQRLVMASDAKVSAQLLKETKPKLSNLLDKIPYASMVTLSLGFKKESVGHKLDGFGVLIPRSQKLRTLGALFCSSLFAQRAPEGTSLIKVYLGGDTDPDALHLSDQAIINTAIEDLQKPLSLPLTPLFARVKRIPHAIPLYNMGHLTVKNEIKEYLKNDKEIFLVGNYLDGVSVNDTIKSSAVLEELPRSVPEIVKNDAYLGHFEGDIKRRQLKMMACEAELLANNSAGTLNDFANGHKYFGLHLVGDSWYLREWAPNATRIVLVGSFTKWREYQEFELEPIDRGAGVWEIKVPRAIIKHLDYYRLNVYWHGGMGERIPSYANYVVQDPKTYLFCAQVWNPSSRYQMKNKRPKRENEAPIIYEAHVGMSQIDAKVGTYKEFQEKVLPRIKEGGYNTVQLMAIQEHPYYGSFGYQVSNFFASSSRSGTPDELRELIDTAHGMGIRVIMDIVHSHAVKNENEGIAKFDGTQHQYFHGGGKGLHPAWDTMCFDYGKPHVLHFLLSNCKYWIEEFGFDGYRFDGVTSMLYFSHGLGQSFSSYYDYFNMGVDEDAIVYFMLANKLIHQVLPDAVTIAEDMSGMPGMGMSVEKGGIGFDYRLSMGVPDFWIKTLKEKSDEQWNVEQLYHELTNRRADENVISYAESHDQALVGDKTIIFWLIDADMYWNMSVFTRNLRVDRGVALHKLIRLVTMATARGGYLNFMGNEFGHPEWIDFPRAGNGWSYHYARRRWDLADDDTLCYKYLVAFDREMVKFARDTNLLAQNDPKALHFHVDDHVLAFERKGYIFIFNFDAVKSYESYGIHVGDGRYMQLINSDELSFGGMGRSVNGKIYETYEGVVRLYLPTRSALILKRI